jgi:hypothetical protein
MQAINLTAMFIVGATAVRVKYMANELIDLTGIVQEAETEPSSKAALLNMGIGLGVRCCCDASSNWKLSDWFGNKGRSSRCKVFETREKKCSDRELPSWAVGPLRHYSNSGVGRCMVHPDDVREVYDKYGSSKTYCQAVQSETFDVGAAGLGGKMPVQCKNGYIATHTTTTCNFVSASAGEYLPKPVCTWAENWCQDVVGSREESHPVWVSSAALGATAAVQCKLGEEPQAPEVTCSVDKTFSPMPQCVTQPNFCKAIDSAEARYGAVAMAAYGEQKKVMCYARGYIPQSEFVHCGVAADGITGEFLPAGPHFCVKDPQYCPAIEADMFDFISGRAATVDAGAMDEDKLVRCREGFQASHVTVRCGSDKQFRPAPTCSRISDWCPSVDIAENGGLYVPQAGRDESVSVQCMKGFHPAHAKVTCGRSHNFDPSPSCIRDA